MRRSSFRRGRVLRSFGPTVLGVLLFIGGGVAAHADGTVEVRRNREVLGRVDLSSASFHPRRIFPVATFDVVRSGHVHVVASGGARVEIDGLGSLAA